MPRRAATRLDGAATFGSRPQVGPALVKAFVPQLQATFAKALRDPARDVRTNGVTALGLLAPLSTRLDALVADLAAGATGDDAPDAVAAACLRGLSAVFANPGAKPPSGASEEVALAAALDLEGSEDPEVAKAAMALSAALGGG